MVRINIIYFDENLPPRAVRALKELVSHDSSIQVKSLKEEFGEGTDDEIWLPKIAGHSIITADHNIHRKKSQFEIYKNNNVGFICLKTPRKSGLTYNEQIILLLKNWDQICETVLTIPKPFSYFIDYRTSRFQSF